MCENEYTSILTRNYQNRFNELKMYADKLSSIPIDKDLPVSEILDPLNAFMNIIQHPDFSLMVKNIKYRGNNEIQQQDIKMDDTIKIIEERIKSIENVYEELKSTPENRVLIYMIGDLLSGLRIQVDHMKDSISRVQGKSEKSNDSTGNTPQENVNKILKEHLKWLNGNGGRRADFRGIDLTGVDFSNVNLSKADLRWAHFPKVDFSNNNLSKADLSWGNFPWANFTGANLVGADLSRSNFSWANFTGANLVGASFNGSNLSKTNLTGADLTRVDLCGADLHGATVTNTIFTKANLTFTDFSMVDISSAIDLCII